MQLQFHQFPEDHNRIRDSSRHLPNITLCKVKPSVKFCFPLFVKHLTIRGCVGKLINNVVYCGKLW